MGTGETNLHPPSVFRPIEVLDQSFDRSRRSLAFRPDDQTVDAYGRLRTAHPVGLWDSQFEYNLHPLYFDTIVGNGGTVTHDAPHSSADLNVTTTDGSRAIIQTFEYFQFQPGKSQQVQMSFIPSPPTTGLIQRIGQFDDENGFFFQVDGSEVSVVRRSKASGSVVDHKTVQAKWGDRLDGEGPSINLHAIGEIFPKINKIIIDYQWPAGRIRYAVDIRGTTYVVHDENISGEIDEPSVVSANLPIRWEMDTSQAIAGARTMQAIGVSVVSEGGSGNRTGHTFSGGNGMTLRTGIGATPVPIASIRPALTLNSITNRVKVELENLIIFADASMFWELIYKPTSITGASFSPPVTHSSVEVDIAGTAITGGIVIDSGYIAANNFGGLTGPDLRTKFPFTLDAAGLDQSRSLSVVVSVIGAQSNRQAGAQFNWVEVR